VVTAGKNQDMTGEIKRLEAIAMASALGLECLSMAAGGNSETVGGAFCWNSSSYVPAFNGAGLFSEDLFNDNTLSAIDSHFRERGRPYSIVTIDGLGDAGRTRLLSRGYYEFDASPAMLLEGEPNRWNTNSGATVRQVTTPEDLSAFRHVISKVFHISPLEVDLILNDGVLKISKTRNYLGLVRDTPVATATLVLEGNLPGIWNVGTLPDYRRRGISTEIMHRLIEDSAALGFSSTMLLASPDGLPLYRKLGYRTLSTLRMYAPSRQPSYGDF
jgi:ribosomal protein S18 acetylase RimI-like enzyme